MVRILRPTAHFAKSLRRKGQELRHLERYQLARLESASMKLGHSEGLLILVLTKPKANHCR